MPVNVAVIPVAGRGTRLIPLTKSQPKEMLPLGRRPTVQHVVQERRHRGRAPRGTRLRGRDEDIP